MTDERRRERNRLYMQKYRKTARGKEVKAAWAKAHPEVGQRAVAKYHAKIGVEKRRELHRNAKAAWRKRGGKDDWKIKNPDRYRELVKKGTKRWIKKHPEQWRSLMHAYRARKLNASGTHTSEDVKAILALQDNKCFYCKKPLLAGYHIEHMTPLSRGGSNGPENIVCSCQRCNSRKHTKTAAEFFKMLANEREASTDSTR